MPFAAVIHCTSPGLKATTPLQWAHEQHISTSAHCSTQETVLRVPVLRGHKLLPLRPKWCGAVWCGAVGCGGGTYPINPDPPFESACSTSPCHAIVTVSNPRCGCWPVECDVAPRVVSPDQPPPEAACTAVCAHGGGPQSKAAYVQLGVSGGVAGVHILAQRCACVRALH